MNGKIVWRMLLLVLSLCIAGRPALAEETAPPAAGAEKKSASFEITEHALSQLKEDGLPADVLSKLGALKQQKYRGEEEFLRALEQTLGKELTAQHKALILKAAYYYDGTGRRQPFQSPAQGTPVATWTPLPGEPGKTPLEQFELQQLRVTGIILGGLGDHATLLAPDGKSYNLTVGTPIGKFKGKVVAITANAVVVKETKRSQKDADIKTEEVEVRLVLTPLQERAP